MLLLQPQYKCVSYYMMDKHMFCRDLLMAAVNRQFVYLPLRFSIYTQFIVPKKPSSYWSCCCWTSSCRRISVSERIGWLKICWSCSCWTRGICDSNPLAASLLSRNDLVYVCACLISHPILI